jgi:hypothetical protein
MPPFPFKSLEKEKENPSPPSLSRVKKVTKKLQMKINKQKMNFFIKNNLTLHFPSSICF